MKKTVKTIVFILFAIPFMHPGNPAIAGVRPTGLSGFVSKESALREQLLREAEASFSETAVLSPSDAEEDDGFGWAVAIDGDTAVIGAMLEDGGPGSPTSDSGAAYVYDRNLGGPDAWGEVARLTASDAQEGDEFGFYVAISGDTIVVGASLEDGGPGDPLEDAGAVYIFERNAGGPDNWGQVARLTADDSQAGALFGGFVSIDGNTLVVGALLADGGPGNSIAAAGAAYVFERNEGGAGNWGQVAKLYASDAKSGDLFGFVALDGNTIVVGAEFEDGGIGDPISGAGAAYVYYRNLGGNNNWGEAAKLTASDAQTQDRFGRGVAIDGDTIAVAAWFEDGGPGDPQEDSGAAYVFERNLGGADNWGQAARLMASDAQEDDKMGRSIGVSGNVVVVGAESEDGGAGDPLLNGGAVYVFARDQGGAGNWGEVEKLLSNNPHPGVTTSFGRGVAIDFFTLIIGASGDFFGPPTPGPRSGLSYVYEKQVVFTDVIYLPVVMKE